MGRVRVLVVEDDESVRELVSFHLRRAGFDPLEAADAETAWEALPDADAVVLDDDFNLVSVMRRGAWLQV